MFDSTPSGVPSEGGTPFVSTAQQAAWKPGPVKRTRKVAILGFAETVRDCPWQDPSWELWAMNGFWRAAKPDFGIDIPEERYSLWLDMHSEKFTAAYGKLAGFGDAQDEWLKKEHPFPIYMLTAPAKYPSVVAFPADAVASKLGRDYFTSSIAYALTLALSMDDVAEVGVWGIDLVHGSEYEHQRPCAEYWIGRMEGAGIKVTVHEQSALMNNRGRRYGFAEPDPVVADLRAILSENVEKTLAMQEQRKAQVQDIYNAMHTDDGALQMANGILNRLAIYERGGRI